MSKKAVTNYIRRDPLKSATYQNNVAVILSELGNFELTEDTIENLARSGVGVKNICGLFGKTHTFLDDNPLFREAFNRGRSNVATRVRAKLLDAALEEDNMTAAMYLDKIYGGEQVVSEVNLTVTNTPLAEISTNELLDVTFDVKSRENDAN